MYGHHHNVEYFILAIERFFYVLLKIYFGISLLVTCLFLIKFRVHKIPLFVYFRYVKFVTAEV